MEKTVAEMGERLTPEYIDSLTEEELQPLIRSCGFYRAKARYVKALTAWFKGYGYEAESVREKSLHDVRQELLALPGIGAETADAILTYAFRMQIRYALGHCPEDTAKGSELSRSKASRYSHTNTLFCPP